MRWLAICNASDTPQHHRSLAPQPMPELLGTGTLIVELALSTAPRETLAILDYAETRGWARALSLGLAPDGTLTLGQRQGGAEAHVALRLDLPREMHGLRLTYTWNAPARRSHLTAEILHGGHIASTAGSCPLPIPAHDIARLFARDAGTTRHRSVSWMAVSSDELIPSLGAGLSAGSPVRTPSGPVRADSLRAGALVLTADHGPRPLRWAGTLTLPAQGSFTPIRLRAPYFAPHRDLVVAPTQKLALSGAEVEYLFGEDEVLAEARHFTNGRTALLETRRPFVTYVFLLLDHHEVLFASDCAVESLYLEPAAQAGLPAGVTAVSGPPARRLLAPYEAITLRHMLERADHLTAA